MNEYATLAELKRARKINDTTDDTDLQAALTRASRAIDKRCGRRFYRDAAVSARTWRVAGRTRPAFDGELMLTDDIATSDGLIVEIGDGVTWNTVTDYFLEPDSAVVKGEPITGIRRDYSAWGTGYRARVTAVWGWPEIPDSVTEATLLLASRRFMRRFSPEGVSGFGQDGVVRVSRFDSDIEDLIGPYVLDGFA